MTFLLIIPKEFKEEGAKTKILFNKQFYWFTSFEPEAILSDELLETTMKVYLANKKVMDYFAEAISH